MPHPLSLRKNIRLAGLLGFLAPVLVLVIRAIMPWKELPWPLILAALASLVPLYWFADLGQFRRDRSSVLQSFVAVAIFLVGLSGSVWCFLNHVCMGGHMAHPPYQFRDYLIDGGWAVALVFSSAWLARIRSPLSLAVIFLAGFTLFFRFVLGSLGGLFSVPL
jgi:heme/copper-type cytochrome/quinol oxidase subunit 4